MEEVIYLTIKFNTIIVKEVYTSVFTLSPSITVTNGVIRGTSYRVRYRAQNFNDWESGVMLAILKLHQGLFLMHLFISAQMQTRSTCNSFHLMIMECSNKQVILIMDTI
jgi:hypothetical protein